MAEFLHWQTGLRRLSLIATVLGAAGVLLLVGVWIPLLAGYHANPGYAPLYNAFWVIGLMLLVLGLVLWALTWAVKGFLPAQAQR